MLAMLVFLIMGVFSAQGEPDAVKKGNPAEVPGASVKMSNAPSQMNVRLPMAAEPGYGTNSLPGLKSQPTSTRMQVAIVMNATVIKPVHMLLSLMLIIFLWRNKSPDLALVKWSLITFWVGEAICAVNWITTDGQNLALELGHDVGMLGLGTLLPLGLFKMAEDRFLRMTTPEQPCALLRFCGDCWKRNDAVSCRFKLLFIFGSLALAIMATMPFALPLESQGVVLPVFDGHMTCLRDEALQFVEFRVFPALAIILLMGTVALLLTGKHAVRKAQLPFFLGFSFLSLSLMRFFLLQAYRRSPAWTYIWEEITELLTVVFVLGVLYIFRRQLDLKFPRFLLRQKG
jgi:hypothetical protein